MGHRARAKFVVMTDCVPSNEQTFYPQSSLGKSTRQSTLLSTGMRPCHGISASGWDCLKPRSDGSRFEECSRHTRRGRGERQRRGRKIFDDNAGKGKERGKGKGKRKRKRGGARGSRPPSGLGWLLFYPRGGCVDRAPGGGGPTGGVEGWAVLARVERKKEKKRKERAGKYTGYFPLPTSRACVAQRCDASHLLQSEKATARRGRCATRSHD